jgi:hypothetical protein
MRRTYGPRMTSSPQHRRRRIRRTVGVASLATFAIAWGTIAGTGAMGHTGSTATTTTQSGQSAQRSTDDGSGFSADDGGQTAQQSQQQLPQMTTRQS